MTVPELTDVPQGDLRLLADPTAQQLLRSTELARLAYVAKDGTPRAIPMNFLWTGTEIVLATFATSAKLGALRRRPAVALTIDTAGPPPAVLLLRGSAEIDLVDGAPTEYRDMQARYYGEEQAAAVVAGIERVGARMARIVIVPTWAATMDFQTRFPGGLVAAGLTG
jgi:PPOX class probable F420-dependent enzyme